jgi:acetyl-CoA/propionyl-CoA carboxylase carboxyl transferase subunit
VTGEELVTITTPQQAASTGDTGEAPADPRDPDVRLKTLFDRGSLTYLTGPNDFGVTAARGTVEGDPVLAFCSDARLKGGALGIQGCQLIADTIDAANAERVPVIGLWHCGGARLQDGVQALDGIGRIFAAMVRASGRIPQISVVLGPAAGGAAYGPALTDVVIMSDNGRIFVTGPDVVRSVTGEQVDMERLGGPDPHGRRSGVVHITTKTDEAAIESARTVANLLGNPGRLSVADATDTGRKDLGSFLPEQPTRAYDVKPLVKNLLDAPGIELHAKWAPNVVTVLGRFGGRSVGVIANNPMRLGGCLDASAAEKAARFVRMCDSLGLPLLVLVDVPGYLPGVGQEWDGVVRRGAKLLHAFAETVVPRITLVTRKSYGGAYIAMNSRALGATAVFAWPQSEIAVMGAAAAVNVLYRKQLAAAAPEDREALRAKLVTEQEQTAGGAGRATEIGVVDEVIDPAHTRTRLAQALADAPDTRGAHGNIPL